MHARLGRARLTVVAAVFSFLVWFVAPVHAQTAIRVNVGGPAYTDTAGNVWSADTGFNSGTLYSISSAIAGTTDDALYQTGRYDASAAAPSLQYSTTVPNGWYEVRLHFAEPVLGAGQRRFNVNVEGTTVLGDLDLAAEAGVLTALVKSVTVNVTDGQLNIDFLYGTIQNPTINAIEILSTSAPSTIRVRAGGPVYTDSAGHVWSSDVGYNSGTPYSVDSAIAGTIDDTLYQRGRYDASTAAPTLQYSFWVPNGWYEVRLHFAEPVLGAGARQFDVKLEGTKVLADLDLAAEAGLLTALVKPVVVRVTDGQLNIELLHGAIQNPTINAIEILSTDLPTTPLGLSASTISGTQVNLSWQPSTDNSAVVGYGVERCLGATCTNFAQITFCGGPSSYADSGLAPLTTYRYRVRAIDDAGNAMYSTPVSATTTVSGAFTTIRVNAGGGAYTDTAGHVWTADAGYNTGTVFSANQAITGTSDQTLYQAGRYDAFTAPPVLQYRFAVPNGGYEVHLHFAEPGVAPGGRKFNVTLGGAAIFTNLDVATEAGGTYAALIKTATTQVTDGYLTLQFLHGPGHDPFVNAIEIIQTTTLDTQPPSAPAALSAVALSGTRIDLAWNAATDNVGTTGYRLDRCPGIACSDFSEVAGPTGTSFSDTSLSPATTYRYRLRAVDAAGNYSTFSMLGSATTFVGSDSQAPTAPGSLAVSAVSVAHVALSWTASTDNTAVVGYRVERCPGASCSNFTQIATATGTSYSDSGVASGTTYRYRVRAADAVPNLSAYSSVVSATTLAGGGDAESPSAPGSVTANALSANRIALGWSASTDNVGVTGYLVERCTGAACSIFSQIAAISPITAYLDAGLTGGATYRYRLRGRDAAGNVGVYSAVVTATTDSGSGRAGNTTYQYDSFGRLKQVTVTPQ